MMMMIHESIETGQEVAILRQTAAHFRQQN